VIPIEPCVAQSSVVLPMMDNRMRRILLFSAWYGIVAETRKLQRKDCPDDFPRLCCMIYAAKWSTDMNESMCIHQNHKRWWVMRFWKCRGALHNNTLLEQVISQEIYRRRPICYRLRCMPSVWLMSEDVWRLKVYLVVVVLICNTRSYIIEEYQVRCFDRWGYLCNGWRTPAIVKPER